MSLVRRSLWLSLADNYLGLVLQLAGTMILSRLLTPREVGIVAVASVFSSFASMFRDFGVAEYMIQEKDLTRQRMASALALNIIVSWSMAALMFGGAPWVGRVYGESGIAEVMQVFAMGFLIVPFGAVTIAYFRRQLDYRPMLVCNLASNVTTFAVSVSLVLLGHSYMSLAWSMLAGIAVSVLASMWFRPADFPRWPSLAELGHVFGFSKFAGAVYIFGQVGKGAPEIIIGRAQGVADLAMYSRGNGLVEMFNRLLMRPVMSVCMPYFAHSERETGSVAAAYLRSIGYVTAVGWPFLAFVALAATGAIRIVYGSQWDLAIPIAQILCGALAFEIMHAMSREALLSRGLARQANSLQMGLLAMQIAGLLMVVPFGLQGAAWGVMAASACGVLLSHHYLARGIGLRAVDMWRACRTSLQLSVGAVAPAAIWAFSTGVNTQHPIGFAFGGGVLTALSWLLMARLMRHELMQELVSTVGRIGARFSR